MPDSLCVFAYFYQTIKKRGVFLLPACGIAVQPEFLWECGPAISLIRHSARYSKTTEFFLTGPRRAGANMGTERYRQCWNLLCFYFLRHPSGKGPPFWVHLIGAEQTKLSAIISFSLDSTNCLFRDWHRNQSWTCLLRSKSICVQWGFLPDKCSLPLSRLPPLRSLELGC